MKNLFDNQQIDRKKYQKIFAEIKEEAAPGGTAPNGLLTPSYGGANIENNPHITATISSVMAAAAIHTAKRSQPKK